MSRLGRKEVPIPAGVKVSVGPQGIEVSGPKGSLRFPVFPEVTVEVGESAARVSRAGRGDARRAAAIHGLVRAHLANMVVGVTRGFSRSLEIHGTGWSARAAGKGVELIVGHSRAVVLEPPPGVAVAVVSPTEIAVSGADKQAVGEFAARLRAVRPPEPYKGKGIRYKGEEIRRKVGKALG